MTKLNRLTGPYPTIKSKNHTILFTYTIFFTLLFCLSNHSYAQTKAFPIAEGFGKYASGGRGGTVIKVKNLNNSGPGSFREAVTASGTRTVVFEVGGTINLSETIYVDYPNMTIAGQTAPGDGILIKGATVQIQTSNVIIRYLRFRPGPQAHDGADAFNITAWGGKHHKDIIVDHCSFSWALDENFDVRALDNASVKNVTLQNSIISECGYGVVAGKGTTNLTFYRNLFANNRERSIRKGYPIANTFDFEMINNLVYGFQSATVPSMGSKFTVLNNKYKKSSGVPILVGAVVDGTPAGSGVTSQTYAYIEGNILAQGTIDHNYVLNPYIKNSPYTTSGIQAIQANELEGDLLNHVGSSLPSRDAVDIKITNQYINGNGTLVTSGVYPSISNGTPLSDSDNDGMPNIWETQNGLNPNNSSDRNNLQPDGYTNLEYYLNGMSIVSNTTTGCSNTITSFPYSESFENTLGAWTQSSIDDMDWTVDANGTPSSGTGPSSAAQSTYYMYVEASGNLTKQALLNSPCFDLSNLSNANFSFKYHQYGSSDGGTIALEASDDNGVNWASIWNSSGNLGDTWLTANIDLGAYVGGDVQLRFNRVIGNSYQADIAIDDVNLSGGVNTGTNDCSGEITNFPYSEGFENTLGAWTQSSLDDMDWTVDANGTPSSGTGPSNATQNTYYVFSEASGNPTKKALLNSPCFNLSSLSNASFSFKYHQYGSSDMGTIVVEASDDSGTNWTSVWESTGNKGDTWLTANIDLGAYVGGDVQLRFNRVIGNSYQADIAIDDVSLSGGINTGADDCSGEITTFPYIEGFESTLGAWTHSSIDDMNWTVDANGTPSSETGPSSASQNTYYVFVEASGNPTNRALLNSPCFNLSSLSNASFSFKYHQYGSNDMGTIDVEASDDNGASWTSIWNSAGNLGNTWQTAQVNLGAYVGGSVQLRFNRVIGNSYQADIAIDDVILSEGVSTGNTDCSGGINNFPYTEGFENTLGAWTQSSVDDIDWIVDANGTPSSETGPSNASQSSYYVYVEASGNPTKRALLLSPCFNLSSLSDANFSFKYHQYGSSDIGTIDLEASNDNGTNWTSIWNSAGNLGNTWQTAQVSLGAYVGGSVQLRFNRVIGNSYQADIAIDDVNLSEGVSTGSNGCSGGITSFPYNESFENTLGNWSLSSEDDIDWTTNTNGTPSVGTGPSSASNGAYYAYVEASGNLTKQAILNSPCFNLSGQSSAQFSFKYHQFGASAMGTFDVEASDDNGVSWISIWKSSGNLGNSWRTATINLSAYVGSYVQLRFNRIIGNTWEADIAIDDINLSNGSSSKETTKITTTKTITSTENTTVAFDDVKDIALYPNPVKGGLLKIKSTYTNISFEIYNMVGQLVSKGNVSNKVIDVSNLNGAMYLIRFSTEGETITKRFIKQ